MIREYIRTGNGRTGCYRFNAFDHAGTCGNGQTVCSKADFDTQTLGQTQRGAQADRQAVGQTVRGSLWRGRLFPSG